MPTALPALNLIAEPGRRRATLDIAREIERRGFAGISVSQSVDEFAQNAAYLHEVSGGRFQFGIGIAHAPAYVRMEVKPGKPLATFAPSSRSSSRTPNTVRCRRSSSPRYASG